MISSASPSKFQKMKAHWMAVLRGIDRKSLVTGAPVVAAMLFLVVGVFSTVFLTMQSQDLRQQASEADRNVELVMVPSSTPLRADTLSTIFVRLNTHGQEVDGAQVVFDFKSDQIGDVTLRVKEPSGLRRAWDRVEGINGGKRISLAVITSDPNKPFKNNQPEDIAEIIFTAKEPGDIAMVFDDVLTKSTSHSQGQNVIRPYFVQEYEISSAPEPSPTPRVVSNTGGSSGSSSSSNTGSTTSNTSTTKTNNTGTKSSTSSATNKGVGGSTVANVSVKTTTATITIDPVEQVCNQDCTYSSECGDGFLCYQQQCRRIGNVADTTCESDEDDSIKLCNENCKSSAECQGELICYQGSCRSSANPENLSCGVQTLSENQVIAELCDTECLTNAECGDSLSCYQGNCRLSSNPTSMTCLGDSAGNLAQGDDEPTVRNGSATPSPSPIDETASESESSSPFAMVLRFILIIGLIAGLGVAGVMGYLWFKDRQTSGL